MAKLKLGVGIPENLPKGDIKCPVCMIAKGTRSNKLLPTYQPVEKLGVIACDLIGPFEIPTFDEGKYILTIRDLSTSYSEIKILKNKGETNKLLIEKILKFENVTEKKVKCICSDNGLEFESNVLATFIKEKGIQAERSLLYHHYQNGAIERFNRTIQDMGRAALTDSCLPHSFWGFAFLWANYTLNRLPNKVSGNKTPFEAFYGY
jgi:IS30 family transposase